MQSDIYLLFIQFLVYLFHRCSFVLATPIIGHNIVPAKRSEFSFVVSIMRISNDEQIRQVYQSCTGSLISKRDVLTASHCLDVDSTHPIQVIVGSSDITIGKKYFTNWWIVYDEWALYKDFIPKFKDNDIGIIRLSQNVSDDITLPHLWTTPNFDVNKLNVRAAGWGIMNDGTHPVILQTVSLKILKRSECEKKMSTLLETKIKGDERFLCSYAEPYALVNLGDSGGPLVYRNSIIAINRGTCPYSVSNPEKVNLHFGINFYKDFIEDVVTNFSNRI